ncbi:MAG TPA: NUDIX domain-containing protein [Gammaproteobacteria bacterium]|nr:NUDIX domain-containing protein [Gammaproteobacteria bacterium]
MKRSANTFDSAEALFNQNNDNMVNLIPQIRNTTRALIIRDRHILLIRKEYANGQIRLAFPGGGQEADETLIQSLQRECMEEIAAEVKVRKLLHVADCFKLRDMVPLTTRHLVEFFFECSVTEDYIPRNGHHPDKHQVAVVWEDIRQLAETDIFLPALAPYLNETKNNDSSVYLGKFC